MAEMKPHAAAEVRHAFVYGTLRPDYSPTGDRWGVVDRAICIFQRARTHGFALYETEGLGYPFACRSGTDMSTVLHGYLLSWPTRATFLQHLEKMNQIEGSPLFNAPLLAITPTCIP